MTSTTDRRFCILTATALAIACLCLAPPPVEAGVRPQKALTLPAPKPTTLPKLLVVKGGTFTTPPVPGMPLKLQQPPRLSLTAKIALLAQTTIPNIQLGGPFTLTPARPSIAGRGYLSFRFAWKHDTDPQTGGVTHIQAHDGFSENSNLDRRAALTLLPEAPGKRYLIDFLVGGASTYYLVVNSNGQKQTFSGTQHVTFLYEASDTTPATFRVSGGGVPVNVVASWQFYGCEITPLN